MRFAKVFTTISIAARLQKVLADANAFTNPLAHTKIHAGETCDITWTDLSGNEATLTLLKGDPANLETVKIVASNFPNNGVMRWKISDQLAPGDYALKLDSNNGKANYSPKFEVLDPVTPNNIMAKQKAIHKNKI